MKLSLHISDKCTYKEYEVTSQEYGSMDESHVSRT